MNNQMIDNNFYNHQLLKSDDIRKCGWDNVEAAKLRYEAVAGLVSPDAVVLDYGCGTGNLYPYIKDIVGAYYGADTCEGYIYHTKSKYPELVDQIFLIDDLNTVSQCIVEGEFDEVLALGVFTHLPNGMTEVEYYKNVLDNIQQLLPSSVSNTLYFTGFHDKVTYKDPSTLYFNREKLVKDLTELGYEVSFPTEVSPWEFVCEVIINC